MRNICDPTVSWYVPSGKSSVGSRTVMGPLNSSGESLSGFLRALIVQCLSCPCPRIRAGSVTTSWSGVIAATACHIQVGIVKHKLEHLIFVVEAGPDNRLSEGVQVFRRTSVLPMNYSGFGVKCVRLKGRYARLEFRGTSSASLVGCWPPGFFSDPGIRGLHP